MKDWLAVDGCALEMLMRGLVGYNRRPAACLMVVTANADGRSFASHAQLAERTGRSKRTVQDALRHLVKRSLVAVERRGRTEAAAITPLTPWLRDAG